RGSGWSGGLRRVRGNDQVVRAARGAGPAYLGEQAPMVSRCLDPGAVSGDRYRGDGQLVVIERRAVDGSAFVGDQDAGDENQAPAHGSCTSGLKRLGSGKGWLVGTDGLSPEGPGVLVTRDRMASGAPPTSCAPGGGPPAWLPCCSISPR